MNKSIITTKENNGKKFLHIKEEGFMNETAVALHGGFIRFAQEIAPFPQTMVLIAPADIQAVVDFLRSEGIDIK